MDFNKLIKTQEANFNGLLAVKNKLDKVNKKPNEKICEKSFQKHWNTCLENWKAFKETDDKIGGLKIPFYEYRKADAAEMFRVIKETIRAFDASILSNYDGEEDVEPQLKEIQPSKETPTPTAPPIEEIQPSKETPTNKEIVDLLIMMTKLTTTAISTKRKVTGITGKQDRKKKKQVKGQSGGFKCFACKGSHVVQECHQFLATPNRQAFLRQHKICFHCLKHQHDPRSPCKTRATLQRVLCQGNHLMEREVVARTPGPIVRPVYSRARTTFLMPTMFLMLACLTFASGKPHLAQDTKDSKLTNLSDVSVKSLDLKLTPAEQLSAESNNLEQGSIHPGRTHLAPPWEMKYVITPLQSLPFFPFQPRLMQLPMQIMKLPKIKNTFNWPKIKTFLENLLTKLRTNGSIF